ncbi:MAG: NUDIX hydrolase [Anaerolineales bacterium]|nr:NUDIX hydrolase [Anaerolineales bacterium]
MMTTAANLLPSTVPPAPPVSLASQELDNLTEQVAVVDAHGRVVMSPRTQLRYSPAVYGVLVEESRTLLCVHPTSGFYAFPGGRVTDGQTVEQAVRQHFRAATGITPYVQEMLFVEEQFVLDDDEQPWQLTMMYYRLSRPPVGHMGLIDFENPAKPDWVPLKNLTRQQMQSGYDALLLAMK